MFRAALLALLVLTYIYPAAAQDIPPDYAVRSIRGRFADGNRQAVVEFEVQNLGGAAAIPATARLVVIATGQEVATATVPPLQAAEIHTVSMTFPAARFEPGSAQSLRVAVGIDEVEAAGSQTIPNNYAQISLTFPERIPAESTPEAAPPETPETPGEPASPLDVLGIDWDDPVQVAVAAGIAAALGLLLLLAFIILRLLFRRPPDYSSWQPTYGSLFPLDPSSTGGRRQQWQSFAQNGSLPPICADNSVHACKRLFGIDGAHLAGWRVTALRISQYDMYGRINRSQVIAPRRLARALDGAMRRGRALSGAKLERRLRPVAHGLVNKLNTRLNDRSAMLPVALDLRFQGRHGEVRILFELYQCQGGQWQLLDQWEPEMTISGKTINESYTYTFYGLRPGETVKTFRQRLQDDLVRTLAEMIRPQVFSGDTTPNEVIATPTQTRQPRVE